MAILYKVKDILNQSSLYTMCCSFFIPYVIYCVEVWGNTSKTNTNPISILQKRAMRTVNKPTYREPTNPLFIKPKALNLRIWSVSKLSKSCTEQKISSYQTIPKPVSNENKNDLCVFSKQSGQMLDATVFQWRESTSGTTVVKEWKHIEN